MEPAQIGTVVDHATLVAQPPALLRIIFLLTIFSLCWMQPFLVFGGQRLTPTDLLFPVLVMIWLAALVLKKIRLRWHPVFWLFGFYFLTLLISSIFSVDQRSSFTKLAGEAYLLVLAAVTYNVVQDIRETRLAVTAWVAGTAVAVSVGLFAVLVFYIQPGHWVLEYITYHYGAVPIGNFPRISSLFVSASMFCNYLNVSAVMLLIMWRNRWIGRWPFLTGIGAIAICSVFTVSIGLGGIVLASGLWLWTYGPTRPFVRRIALAGGLTIALAFFAVSFVSLTPCPAAPYLLTVPASDATLCPSSRLLVWAETLVTLRNNILTGKGLNTPTSLVIVQNTEGTNSLLTDAHNTFLSVAAQNGIFSLCTMLLICGYVLWLGFSGGGPNGAATGLGIAFLTAFIYQGLTGSFEDVRHLWVMIGLLLSSSRIGGGIE